MSSNQHQPPQHQRGAMLMNPPAPSPRPQKGSISPNTGTIHRRAGLNPPAPSPLSSHQRHHDKARDKAAIAAAAVAKVIKSRSRSRYVFFFFSYFCHNISLFLNKIHHASDPRTAVPVPRVAEQAAIRASRVTRHRRAALVDERYRRRFTIVKILKQLTPLSLAVQNSR